MHCAPLFQCVDDAEKLIGSKGIDNDTMIVAFDDYKGPNASGVWYFFKSYGHDKVRYVDGGLAQLKKLGMKIVKTDEPKVVAKKYEIDQAKIRYDLIASKYDVLKASNEIEADKGHEKYAIIDTRRFAEIMGSSKLDNVARGGHIPGSTFLEWNNFSDAKDKMTFINKDEIQKLFDSRGITKDKTIYTYCHVGTGRGSYVASILMMLGYKNVKVYSGSWDEWGNDFNMPIRR
jgi:thiosulfate/3-mercaptopyruvate sulfurtransferase